MRLKKTFQYLYGPCGDFFFNVSTVPGQECQEKRRVSLKVNESRFSGLFFLSQETTRNIREIVEDNFFSQVKAFK